jgi:glycosyltransferase involved in cell wall biosynthesis
LVAPPLHVGLNLIFLVPGETGGMEVVARELIPALIAAAPQMRFTAFINREAQAARNGPWGEILPAVTIPVHARNRVEWVRAEQLLLPPLAARRGVKVLHSLGSTAPGWGDFTRVTTVHDLIYRHFPEAHMGIRDRGMRVLVPLAVRRAHRVIADSHSTRRDLVELLQAPAERIDVVPLGLGTPRRAAPLSEQQTRERFGLGQRRVLLTLSAKRPHKNLPALIRVLGRLAPERRPVLVIPGYATSHELALRQQARLAGVEADVRFPSWVTDAALEGLWAVADGFVFPSLYEGFGLPVLEAMARGVPVASSNAASLTEVAGRAALLFDPRDERAMFTALQTLLEDPDEAARLRAAGRERVREFTWERTARETLASYRRALDSATVIGRRR